MTPKTVVAIAASPTQPPDIICSRRARYDRTTTAAVALARRRRRCQAAERGEVSERLLRGSLVGKPRLVRLHLPVSHGEKYSREPIALSRCDLLQKRNGGPLADAAVKPPQIGARPLSRITMCNCTTDNDDGYGFTISRHDAPELCKWSAPKNRGRRRDPQARAREMPGARCTHSPCAKCSKHTVVTTGSPEHPAFPARWF